MTIDQNCYHECPHCSCLCNCSGQPCFCYCTEDYEDGFFESCEKCGREYDHIDYDFQTCSKCGWDSNVKQFGEKREPTDEDFLNEEADILTGQWL